MGVGGRPGRLVPGGLGNGKLLGLSQLDKVNVKNIPIDNVYLRFPAGS